MSDGDLFEVVLPKTASSTTQPSMLELPKAEEEARIISDVPKADDQGLKIKLNQNMDMPKA